MAEGRITKEEIEVERTPSELLHWVESKFKELGSTKDGVTNLRLGVGLAKQLAEEVYPLARFAVKAYGEVSSVRVRPVLGNQNHDAVVTDYACSPPSVSYVEVTQAHEGETEHLRMLFLEKYGYVPMTGPPQKSGTKKTGIHVTAEFEAVSVPCAARHELQRILDAARGKEGKEPPADTALVITFADAPLFRQPGDDAAIDDFVREDIMGLDLRFSRLYLLGRFGYVFREYDLTR